MARPAKRLRVTLERILCTQVSGDSGPTLEIYGTLEARGVVIDHNGDPQPGFQKVLWHVGEDRPLAIAINNEITLNQTVEFPVFKRDFLWIGGRMMEHDDTFANPDDVLGDGFRKVNYDDIKTEFIGVGFSSEEQEVVASYHIEVLGIDPHPELEPG
jgi:hypothetical protein